ncbi:MAG TPA: site-specific DNA-methyltransferase, partial [Dermatophilaceae bacterium]|nr:site-specific DNA-methyltransferase [Dermatophilaceae bacterium]
GRVHFGRKGDSMPVIKTYLAEIKDGVVPHSWWSSDEVGSNQEAKRDHLRKLFPGVIPFATPKPERLLQRVVHIASNKGDIVLDCFAGSGTTAAVAHKMGRRWVTSEFLSSTVEQFTLPRLMKVVAGEDPGGITKAVGWEGGGGFQSVTVGPSMYEDTPFGVLLAEWATNGRFARAVAGQLGFEFQPDAAPLCGVRGRMRLAVIDGTVGPEEIRQIVGALGEKERVTIVAKSVLPQAETILSEVSPGSRIRKAPRDLLTSGARRMRRRTDASPRHTSEMAEGSGS